MTHQTPGDRLRSRLALAKLARTTMHKGRADLTSGPRTAADDLLSAIFPTASDLARARRQRMDLAGDPVPRVAPPARILDSAQAPRIAQAYDRDVAGLDAVPLAYAGNERPMVPRDPFASAIEARNGHREHVLALIADALARKPHSDPRQPITT